jgi:two-component system, sensor histidine kinase and response regulator
VSKTKVLLVDDELRLVETLQEILDVNGYETTLAIDGIQALEKCREFMPDIILCDIMMPKMDGFTFFHHFRETISADTPFIFLTAKSEYSDIRAGMLKGADDYLVKPVKGKDVIDAIQTRLLRQTQILSPELKRVEKLENTIGLITMHEFKNPLTAIIGFLDLIKTKIDTIEKDVLEEYLSYIEMGANRIISLLTKVTTWHQMQNHGNQLNHGSNRTELSGIVAQIALEIAKKYHRINDLALQLKFKPLIDLSPELIKACFSELIDNAFKFSLNGDLVQVSVNSEDMKCIVTIEDNGNRSFASELMEYEPFTQFGKKTFEQQGLGIGINISKSIADLVKGGVEFLNNKPQGIIAKVTIPVNE